MAYTTINKSKDYFSTNLWVADDSSPRSLTGFGHQPDLVWTKHRGSGSVNHTLTDSVRGGDKMLASTTTAVEDTKSHGEITSFDSDGITVADGTNATYPRLYFNDLDPFGAGGGNYVGWSWKANGTGSANTDGTINSTVSVNTTAGFSISKFTGTGANATVGHGLGVAPKIVIIKNRDRASGWHVGGDAIGTDNQYLNLNGTDAIGSAGTGFQSFSSTTFGIGSDTDWNASSESIIAYCFAEKTGYSKFGSYTGNGNADGNFIYTGFKPAFLIVKRYDAGGYFWHMYDNKRSSSGGSNIIDDVLYPQNNHAEYSGDKLDFVSNGIKYRSANGDINGSGGSYIYMAFAEAPLVGTNNVPCTAR